jgi:hypothetical protein
VSRQSVSAAGMPQVADHEAATAARASPQRFLRGPYGSPHHIGISNTARDRRRLTSDAS